MKKNIGGYELSPEEQAHVRKRRREAKAMIAPAVKGLRQAGVSKATLRDVINWHYILLGIAEHIRIKRLATEKGDFRTLNAIEADTEFSYGKGVDLEELFQRYNEMAKVTFERADKEAGL